MIENIERRQAEIRDGVGGIEKEVKNILGAEL